MTSRASARTAKRRTRFRRTTKPIDPRNRLIALLVLFVIIGAGFVAVLVDLQTVRSERYRSIGEDQRTRTRPLAGYRGAVLDRNGFVLAASTPSHRIVADPTMVDDPGATADLLAPILGIDSASLADLLTPSSDNDHFSMLARNVDDEAVIRIEQLESAAETSDALVGVWTRPEEDRVYPAGDLASAVVGRVDPYKTGIFGIERQYNDLMTGEPGSVQFEGGRFGSISVGDRTVDPATAGYNVVLTLDHRIQYVTEQTLLEHCEAARANGATAIMADPWTGEILAMASVVRDPEDGCVVANYNGALIDTFEPGSVIKPMVVAAAMQELSYTAQTLIDVPPQLIVGGKPFEDHPAHPTAPYPITDILAQSMNVGTILLSQRISTDTLYGYLRAFGFGRSSGMDLNGESSGSLRPPDEWWGADHGSIPIGQGLTVNASQLLTAYNVVANGGNYVPPLLVQSLETPDGLTHSVGLPTTEPVITTTTAGEVTEALIAVVERGTGVEAAVDGYQVAGKTGTAWKVFDDGSGRPGYGSDGNRRYVVSFAGFLPAESPRLSLVVVVDEPRGSTTAATVAAPLFAAIADYAIRILAIPPTELTVADGALVRGTPAVGLTPAERARLGQGLAVAAAAPALGGEMP